jgi:hypothetical protein
MPLNGKKTQNKNLVGNFKGPQNLFGGNKENYRKFNLLLSTLKMATACSSESR